MKVQGTILKRTYMESERNLMTTTEAAKYLGLRPSYLYKLMMRRAIPYYKPAVLLRQGGPRRMAETGAGEIAGRDRQRGRTLSGGA